MGPRREYNPVRIDLTRGPYNGAMKLLFDLFPVVLFFVAFKLSDIYTATAVAIAATFLQIGWLKWKRRKVDTMMWISLVIIVVFGGATLALHDETFIKWKPTALYWLFGAVIAAAQLLFRRNLVRAMLGEQVRMPDGVWTRLSWSWAGFFTFMGAANLLVAYNFPTDTWVNFKLFGGMGLMLVFVVLQAVFLARHVEEKDVSS
jgi:intracellular septation protein